MPAVTPESDVVARLGEIQLPEADGSKVALKNLWAKHTVVLVHLRHFG